MPVIFYPEYGRGSGNLLNNNADKALYRVMHGGRNHYAFASEAE